MAYFKVILNLALLFMIMLSIEVVTTARAPPWKIEPHHKTYERLTYIVNDRPRYHNYQVIPSPPPPPPLKSYTYVSPPPPPPSFPSRPPLSYNNTPPPPTHS
ncbi:synaptic defective enhancer 1-like [Trifolium pratense]|uniref:synaptic defective enhancer 1-like n=1 Tax=Trifolium pratense TaxID=57577 RepID=UPI001E691DC5|nr:synaptic defective enhancer 1-like [Trifolium pratense]